MNGDYNCISDPNRFFIHDPAGQRFAVAVDDNGYTLLSPDDESLAQIDKIEGYRISLRYLDESELLYTQNGRFDIIIKRLDLEQGRTTSKTLGGWLWGWAYHSDTHQAGPVTTTGGGTRITGARFTVVRFSDGTQTLYQSDTEYHYAPAWSPDGSILAYVVYATHAYATHSYRLQYLDLGTRKVILDIDLGVSNYYKNISSMQFSPDGTLLAAGYRDGEVAVFNAADGTVLTSWQGHQDDVFALAFSPDASMLETMSDDGFVKVWGIPPFP